LIDRTNLLGLKLGLKRGFDQDRAARAVLRNGAGTTVVSLDQSTPNWNYRDNPDGSITLEVAESATVTRALLLTVASIGLYKNDVEAPFIWANGVRKQWKSASRRIWKFEDYKAAGPYIIPASAGLAGYPSGLLLALTRAG